MKKFVDWYIENLKLQAGWRSTRATAIIVLALAVIVSFYTFVFRQPELRALFGDLGSNTFILTAIGMMSVRDLLLRPYMSYRRAKRLELSWTTLDRCFQPFA